MTIKQLNRKFRKAHLYMFIGTIVGCVITRFLMVKHGTIFALVVGLLFSCYQYSICVRVLKAEYKRLKAKNRNENLS